MQFCQVSQHFSRKRKIIAIDPKMLGQIRFMRCCRLFMKSRDEDDDTVALSNTFTKYTSSFSAHPSGEAAWSEARPPSTPCCTWGATSLTTTTGSTWETPDGPTKTAYPTSGSSRRWPINIRPEIVSLWLKLFMTSRKPNEVFSVVSCTGGPFNWSLLHQGLCIGSLSHLMPLHRGPFSVGGLHIRGLLTIEKLLTAQG